MRVDKRIGIFPGSFDPFTNGHHDIVLSALPLFDKIIIAFGTNSQKERTFPVSLMIDGVRKLYIDYSSIEVESYQGLTSDFADNNSAKFIIRGLRNGADLDYEMPIAKINKDLSSNLETVYFTANEENANVSSTIVRELYKYNKDIKRYIPFDIK